MKTCQHPSLATSFFSHLTWHCHYQFPRLMFPFRDNLQCTFRVRELVTSCTTSYPGHLLISGLAVHIKKFGCAIWDQKIIKSIKQVGFLNLLQKWDYLLTLLCATWCPFKCLANSNTFVAKPEPAGLFEHAWHLNGNHQALHS